MKYVVNGKEYDVVIEYKNIKNMYMRIKSDLCIHVTAPKHLSEKKIKDFIINNRGFIDKNILEKERLLEKQSNKFLFLGKEYSICYSNQKGIILGDSKAFIGKSTNIDNWYKKQALEVFKERYDVCFEIFNKRVKKPELKIRKMTSKWGVCNVTDNKITLNLELIKLDICYIDYVIYHELCHLIFPNHSSDFWSLVEEYVPNYKKVRKNMKNII